MEEKWGRLCSCTSQCHLELSDISQGVTAVDRYAKYWRSYLNCEPVVLWELGVLWGTVGTVMVEVETSSNALSNWKYTRGINILLWFFLPVTHFKHSNNIWSEFSQSALSALPLLDAPRCWYILTWILQTASIEKTKGCCSVVPLKRLSPGSPWHWSLFLIGWIVSSPNLVQTVRWTRLLFWIACRTNF